MTKKKAKKVRKASGPCKFIMCEDPETGKIIARPVSGCPKGMQEKFVQKLTDEGVTCRISKIDVEEE